MTIDIDGTNVLVERKKIKNLYLQVKPPNGEIRISAPLRMSAEEIQAFVIKKKNWIKKQQIRFNKTPNDTKPETLKTGAEIYMLGKKYLLVLNEGPINIDCVFGENRAVLSVPPSCSEQDKKKALIRAYQGILKQEIFKRLPVWENRTGLHPAVWKTRYMTSRWGSCNHRKKSLTFNVQLCQTPPEYLEYVILHELAHLKVPNHGPSFQALMDLYMPDWRRRRRELNDWTIRYGRI